MTAAILFAWVAEIALECIGSFLYRRRSPLLSALLGFCAFTDFVAVPLAQYYPGFIHGQTGWSQFAIKELMLIWLACSICGMFVAENRKSVTRLSAAFLSLGSAAIITAFSASGETLKDKLLDAEIAANFILLGLVAVGWMSRRDRLNQAWKWIVAGFVLMVGSDLIFTALWTFWDGARHFYPLGAIAAQAVWIAGPLKMDWDAKKPRDLAECRADLGKRFAGVKEMRVM